MFHFVGPFGGSPLRPINDLIIIITTRLVAFLLFISLGLENWLIKDLEPLLFLTFSSLFILSLSLISFLVLLFRSDPPLRHFSLHLDYSAAYPWPMRRASVVDQHLSYAGKPPITV